MAKKEKSKPIAKEALKEEDLEKVSIKELIKDERTHKIVGSLLILFSLFYWWHSFHIFFHGATTRIKFYKPAVNCFGVEILKCQIKWEH
jgi:Fe2+ transport system protein B